MNARLLLNRRSGPLSWNCDESVESALRLVRGEGLRCSGIPFKRGRHLRQGGGARLPTPLSPGVTVRKVGNFYIKEVDQNARRLAQWYGRRSLRYQSEALDKLGDIAPSHLFKNGKLITRDAGAYQSGQFWSTWMKGSRKLGTLMNDIRPRNIGANGITFDPGLDPVARALYWTAAGTVAGGAGYGLHEATRGDK